MMARTKGRGKGIKNMSKQIYLESPIETKQRTSSRGRIKSRRQKDSEEYLSAYESVTDIIITDGKSTSDTMQQYENSILEESVFEENKDIDDTLNDSITVEPYSEDKVVLVNDSLDSISLCEDTTPDNIDNEDENKDNANKIQDDALRYLNSVYNLHGFDSSAVVIDNIVPMNNAGSDRKYAYRGTEELINDRQDIEAIIPTFDVVEGEIQSVVADIMDVVVEENIKHVQTPSNNKYCTNYNELQVKFTQCKLEMIGLKQNLIISQQRNEELIAEGKAISMSNSLLNEQLMQQGEALKKNRTEIHRLEEVEATNEYVISDLEKSLEATINKLSLAQENLEFHRDENTKIKNGLKAQKNVQTDMEIYKRLEKLETMHGHTQKLVERIAERSSENKEANISIHNQSVERKSVHHEVGSSVKFSPPLHKEQTQVGGKSMKVNIRNQCLTLMDQYKSKSVEEIRMEDYDKGRITSENITSDEMNCVSEDVSGIGSLKFYSNGNRYGVSPANNDSSVNNRANNTHVNPNVLSFPTHLPNQRSGINASNTTGMKIVPGPNMYSKAHIGTTVENDTEDDRRWLLPRKPSNPQLPIPPDTVITHPNPYEIPNALSNLEDNLQFDNAVSGGTPSSFTRPPTPKKKNNLKILIASSSITKGIDPRRFNKCFDHGKAWFQKWPGGQARHIKNYIQCHLDEQKPDVVLVQAGGNDLAEDHRTPVSIAHDVIEIAHKAKISGVKDISIGGVTVRSKQFSQERLHVLNNALQSLCKFHNFIYIDNSDIKVHHLYDGVHLKDEGITILADNYLKALRLKYGDSQ